MMVGGFGGGYSASSRRSDHHHHHHHLGDDIPRHFSYGGRTESILETVEKRTQRTYRYGIVLVCIGATLNWLGFAQGSSYVDPLRYLGVASVISGSFCVCLAMCRWLGRPISMSGRLSSLEEDSLSSRSTGDVQVFNVAVPLFVTTTDSERGFLHRPTKPPEYEVVTGDPPPPNYDEAIKLTPEFLERHHTQGLQHYLVPPSPCGPSPSHSTCPLLISNSTSDGKDEIETSMKSCSESPPPPYHPPPPPHLLPSTIDHTSTNNSIPSDTNINMDILRDPYSDSDFSETPTLSSPILQSPQSPSSPPPPAPS